VGKVFLFINLTFDLKKALLLKNSYYN